MESSGKRAGDGRRESRASLKRSASDDDDSSEDDQRGEGQSPKPEGNEQAQAAISRSERKRDREKKRRNDVIKGFDELMNLLVEIDPDVRADAKERSRRGMWKGSLGAQEDSVLSRVDLIGRAVTVLRRIHVENEQRKVLIDHLLLQGQAVRPGVWGRDEVRERHSLPMPRYESCWILTRRRITARPVDSFARGGNSDWCKCRSTKTRQPAIRFESVALFDSSASI
jgi:hypothetical protein